MPAVLVQELTFGIGLFCLSQVAERGLFGRGFDSLFVENSVQELFPCP
jgi:hypothetical protein